MSEYPEHDKVRALNGRNNEVGQFIDWLREKYSICTWNDEEERWDADYRGTIHILAEYFEIDLDRFDAETGDMIRKLREDGEL